MDRIILHCDLNSFFASVEMLFYPELSKQPMAVCGDAKTRHGIILAKNELAKAYHIKTAEPVWQALKKCPHLQLVSPHMDRYITYSRKVRDIYQRFTDQVEAFGIDECWLDVTHSYRLFTTSAEKLAYFIRDTVKNELGLTISVGVSFNKIFAKLGSDYKKPNAVTVINRDNLDSFVFPQDISSLLFVGKSTEKKLRSFGIHTIGDLAGFNPDLLLSHLGKLGLMLHDYANGLDHSPVRYYYEKDPAKSIGKGKTFSRDICGEREIHDAISALASFVAYKLRKNGQKCDVISVTIKNPAFQTITRQKKLQIPTCTSYDILKEAMELMMSHWKMNLPIRMITITAAHITDPYAGIQSSFFDTDHFLKKQKQEKLEYVLDDLKSKYGNTIFSYMK